jgi:hypothetical protein
MIHTHYDESHLFYEYYESGRLVKRITVPLEFARKLTEEIKGENTTLDLPRLHRETGSISDLIRSLK